VLDKLGEKDTPNNYRPIAILPVVSKILDKVIAEQLKHVWFQAQI